MNMKKISILGSTGSIGSQALAIIEEHEDKFQVAALSCATQIDLLCAQIERFRPQAVCVAEEADARRLSAQYPGIEIFCGAEGLQAIASMESCDMVLNALMGMRGLAPTLAAICAGKDIAFANKETLVAGGALVMDAVKKAGVKLLPVDSEHSAIFQSLHGERRSRVEKILLTASGGPFRGKTREELADMTVEDALKHPNWSMGKKVTIDSASLCNKGLEVMEAKWLFDVALDQIEVVVHPQSILHSAVQYADGGIMGQMGVPDMKLPIQYALFYPDRRPMDIGRVDLCKLGSLTFEKPDTDTFRGLALAYRAAQRGGSLPTVFNAANEKAVALFLKKKIRFLQIPELIATAMDAHQVRENPTLEEILSAESETYEYIRQKFGE